MIVVDAWVLRQGDAFTLIVPRRGRAAALDLFTPPAAAPARPGRPISPARPRVAWLVGAHGFQALAKSGVGTPESAGAGGLGRRRAEPGGGGAGAGDRRRSWRWRWGLTPAVEPLVARLVRPGAVAGDEGDLHAARLLAGWPALGAEIDERTLPQEVRYDEIGGVSYTKGCYTGQETVARLHFRGHTNRELRGLRWSGPEPLDGRAIVRVREGGGQRPLHARAGGPAARASGCSGARWARARR